MITAEDIKRLNDERHQGCKIGSKEKLCIILIGCLVGFMCLVGFLILATSNEKPMTPKEQEELANWYLQKEIDKERANNNTVIVIKE